MTDLEREELLSAYLDDELSPEERARVERWLAESPELRQLQDELLALRAGLQALPRYRLDHDLAGRVLDRTAPAENKPSDAAEPTIVPGSLQWWQRGSNMRRLLWPALAAAAALLILVYDANQRPDEQQVAQAPQEQREQELQATEEFSDAKIGAADEPSADTLASDSQVAVPENAPASAPAIQAQDRYAQSPAKQRATAAGRRPAGEVLNQSGAPPASDLAMRSSGKALPQAGEMRSKAGSNETLYRQGVAGAKSDAPSTFVCSVSKSYLQSNDFEKLLDKNRIRWERISSRETEQSGLETVEAKAANSGRLQEMGDEAAQSWYFLHTTNEQVNEILSQVPQAARVDEVNRQLPRFTPPRQALAGAAEQGVQVLLVAPQSEATEAAGSSNR